MRSRRHLTIPAMVGVSVAFVAPGFLAAQRAEAKSNQREPLTLAAAVALARANHPSIPAASARGRASIALARQDAAFANPVVEWRQENLGSPLQRDVFVTIAQPFDMTGRRLALRATASDVVRRTVADSISVIRDVEANAARAFWRASLARALHALAQEHRADAEQFARFETERAREGAVAEVSAMRASIEVDRARVAEASALAALTHASADLARAVGVPPSSLPVVSALPAMVPRLAAMPEADVAIRRALTARSELRALRAAEDAARHRYLAEQRALLPDIVLQAGSKQTAGYTTRTVGAAIPLPLFNRNSWARDRAAAELQSVQAELRSAEQSIRTSAEATIASYRALRAAQPNDSTIARATEVAQIATAAYAAGGSSLLELLDARRARSETLTAVLEWVASIRLAETELARALGASPLDSVTVP